MSMKEAIRLTNKTAIALRKSAQRLRTMYFAAAVILSVLLSALGIFLGFLWLPAVPLMIAGIALLDCAIMLSSRSRYLSMLGQAICTEAAAREIRAGKSESRRREQAISDLMRVKADVQENNEKQTAPGAQPFFEPKAEEDGAHEAADQEETKAQTDAPHRRRRQKSLQLIKSEQAK